jgi:glyoxylase-like metal-dependent hydrolase (beta-lactamase superfamily II)
MQVYVHERGAKHLADPSRLMRSAEMVYGDIETLLDIHGEILPVPGKNLTPVTGAKLDIGDGVRLDIFEAAGHAPHHICIFEPESGCLFSGEALGHYLPEVDMLTPAVAPPGFDLDASKETSRKIRSLNPRTICFSQFGQHRDATYVIEKSDRLLNEYAERILHALEQGLSTGEIIEGMLSHVSHEVGARQFSEQSVRGMLMSVVLGYHQYFQRIGLIR